MVQALKSKQFTKIHDCFYHRRSAQALPLFAAGLPYPFRASTRRLHKTKGRAALSKQMTARP